MVRQVELVLERLTNCGYTILVCNQPLRSTQPHIPVRQEMSNHRSGVTDCMVWYGLSDLRKGDEHPTYIFLRSMAPFTFTVTDLHCSCYYHCQMKLVRAVCSDSYTKCQCFHHTHKLCTAGLLTILANVIADIDQCFLVRCFILVLVFV